MPFQDVMIFGGGKMGWHTVWIYERTERLSNKTGSEYQMNVQEEKVFVLLSFAYYFALASIASEGRSPNDSAVEIESDCWLGVNAG